MVIVDRRFEPRPLALGHLAAPVGGHRLEQPPHENRMPLRHGVDTDTELVSDDRPPDFACGRMKRLPPSLPARQSWSPSRRQSAIASLPYALCRPTRRITIRADAGGDRGGPTHRLL